MPACWQAHLMRTGCGATWRWASHASALACRRATTVHAHPASAIISSTPACCHRLSQAACRHSETFHAVHCMYDTAYAMLHRSDLCSPDCHPQQAFQGELLEVCGRSHTLADVEDALAAVAAAAPPSWSLDLISGVRRVVPYCCPAHTRCVESCHTAMLRTPDVLRVAPACLLMHSGVMLCRRAARADAGAVAALAAARHRCPPAPHLRVRPAGAAWKQPAATCAF